MRISGFLWQSADSKNHTGILVTKDSTPFTCDMIGYEGTVYCSDCGNPVSYGESIDAIGHNYGEWSTVKSATEKSEGLRKRICQTCGYADEDIIPVIVKEAEKTADKKTNSSKSGMNNKSKKSEKKTENEEEEYETVSPDDDEEEITVERLVYANKSDNSLIWLFVIIIGSLVISATVLSAVFILKKGKKQPTVPTNKP